MQHDQLIAQLQAGNEKSFERIYELYSRSLYGVIYSIIREEKISEEVLQDVFMKIWQNSDTFDPAKGRFFTWMLNIARNAAIDRIRSKDFKKRQADLKIDTFTDIWEAKSSASGKLDSIGLQKYIELLGPLCKKLIDLLFFKGYTQQETAKELQIPLGTVKTRNRVCIDKLRANVS